MIILVKLYVNIMFNVYNKLVKINLKNLAIIMY